MVLLESFNMQELLDITHELCIPGEDVSLRESGKEETIPGNSYVYWRKSVAKYDECVQQIIKEQEEVISLQEDIISTGGLLGGLLSLSERNSIRTEVDKAKNIFNLHTRDNKYSNYLCDVFDPLLFQSW